MARRPDRRETGQGRRRRAKAGSLVGTGSAPIAALYAQKQTRARSITADAGFDFFSRRDSAANNLGGRAHLRILLTLASPAQQAHEANASGIKR
jgi:hypothetical protein